MNFEVKQKYTDFINVINGNQNTSQNYMKNPECVCDSDNGSNGANESDSELKNEFEKIIKNNKQKNLNKPQENLNNIKNKSETTSSSGLGDNIDLIVKTQQQFKKMISTNKNPNTIKHNFNKNVVSQESESIDNKKNHEKNSTISSNSIEKGLMKINTKILNKNQEREENQINFNSQELKNVLRINDSQSLSSIHTDSEGNKIWVNNKEKKNEELSIDSEFEHIFNEQDEKKDKKNKKDKKDKKDKNINNEKNDKRLDNLEKMYEKMMSESMKKHESKQKNKNDVKKIIDINMDKSEIIKELCEKIDKELYLESTRGFNSATSTYKLKIHKLRSNIDKLEIQDNLPCFVGYMYRDFNNPKIYQSKDANKYWTRVYKYKKSIKEENVEDNDKILDACLKNFKNSKKFKKRIGSSIIRAFKRTVELSDVNNITIDIIFFVKISEKDNQ